MRQVELSLLTNPNVCTTCWLDKVMPRNVGHTVRFKNKKEWWKVLSVGSIEQSRQEVRKTWNVGGL